LHRGLLTVAQDFGWTLEAWSVFSNHYHFVAHSPESDDNAESLSQMLGLLHEKTAKWINKLDICKGRQVWHNFWEMRLTYERILSDTTELCAPESGEARLGGSGESIPLVLRSMV